MITHYETEAAQKKLNNIAENRGTKVQTPNNFGT